MAELARDWSRDRGLRAGALAALLWASVAAAAEPTSPQASTPDGFDARRRLGPRELEDKREGSYVTGLPLVNYDSNTGWGFGARGYFYFDGERSDRRFAYTPYLLRVFLQAFATTGGYQFHWLDVDARNVLDSAFTLRGALIFQRNIDQHYYGIGSRGMRRLSFSGSARSYRRFDDYQAVLDSVDAAGVTRARYDSYLLTQPTALLSLERPLLSGLLRPMLGIGLSYDGVEDYSGQRVSVEQNGRDVRATQGPTRLSEDCAAGLITGCDGGWNNFLRLGLAFDTRDFEPDPNHGVLLDAALDLGTGALGSRYDWARLMLAARSYLSLLPSVTDLVLATRATLVLQSRDTPFFGMSWIPYMEDPRQGLGGLRTLRGYKQDRFVGPVMTLFNAELRWTFARSAPFGQRFAWMVVPFVDVGRADDHLSDVELSGMKADAGLALRAAWNLATIITLEYARSDEDTGVYVHFNHMF